MNYYGLESLLLSFENKNKSLKNVVTIKLSFKMIVNERVLNSVF